MAHYTSFIVRVWLDDNGHLHGQITHVATQEKAHFRDLSRLMVFILDHVGLHNKPEDETAQSD